MGSKIPECQNIFSRKSQDSYCAIQASILHKRVAARNKYAKKYTKQKGKGHILRVQTCLTANVEDVEMPVTKYVVYENNA
jgi:hypothetical protein